MKSAFAILPVVLTGFAVSAFAQSGSSGNASIQPPPPFTGRNLATLCEAPDSRVGDRQGCLRFLHGAATMYEIVANERGKELTWFCLPREGDPAHFRRVFMDWAKENPSQLDQPAILAVKAAFSDIFSCQE